MYSLSGTQQQQPVVVSAVTDAGDRPEDTSTFWLMSRVAVVDHVDALCSDVQLTTSAET